MSGATFIVAVTGAFFLIGIAVGAVAVIAMSAQRSGTKRTNNTSVGWEEPPGPDDGSEGSGPPRWPGGRSGR